MVMSVDMSDFAKGHKSESEHVWNCRSGVVFLVCTDHYQQVVEEGFMCTDACEGWREGLIKTD